MKAYSQDLRERIVQAIESGTYTKQEAAEVYAVSESFVWKLMRRQRHTGSCAALPHGGGRTRTLAAYSEQLRIAVRQSPDATLHELCEQCTPSRPQAVSASMMCRELQRLGLPRKKSPYTMTAVTAHPCKPNAKRL